MHAPPVGLHRLEALVTQCLDLARQMLTANGAFFPFAVVIDSAGNRRPATVESGEASLKTPEVYRVLQRSMNEQYIAGEIVAGAIVAQATIPPEFNASSADGIRVAVESASVARIIFLPYHLSSPGQPEPGNHILHFGELVSMDVRPTIFVD